MTEGTSRTPESRAREFLDSVDEPDGRLEDIIEDARWDAASRLDSSLERVSELRLRLAGPSVVEGFYDPEVEDAFAGPLGRELAAAGSSKLPQTRLGLVGISAGSVVLHYRPHVALLGDSGDQSAVEVTPADSAVRRVLRLHDLFESKAGGAEIAALASGNNALLRGAKGVVEALDKFDLELSATWWSPSGSRVRSTITKIGRRHAASIFKREEEQDPETIWGLVSALDLDGIVVVRRQGQSFRVHVDREQVSQFILGERVHLQVMSVAHVDRVGLRGHVERKYIRHLALEDHLDWIE